ncbi:MAG: hypothetical protein V1871_05780 [Planctomycetota bacterium]
MINWKRLIITVFLIVITIYILLSDLSLADYRDDTKCKLNLRGIEEHIKIYFDVKGFYPDKLRDLFNFLNDDPKLTPKIFKCVNSKSQSSPVDYDIILTRDKSEIDQEIIIYELSKNHYGSRYRGFLFFSIVASYNTRYIYITNPRTNKFITMGLYTDKKFNELLSKYQQSKK